VVAFRRPDQSRLGALDVLGTGAFGALACSVFYGVALAKIIERVGASVTVEEKVIASASRCDEAEALFCDDFFDRSL